MLKNTNGVWKGRCFIRYGSRERKVCGEPDMSSESLQRLRKLMVHVKTEMFEVRLRFFVLYSVLFELNFNQMLYISKQEYIPK